MNILSTLVGIGLAVLSAAVLADPPSQIGRLNLVSGTVSLAPAEANNDWAAATLNRPITTGDRLWTDQDGRAEMHVGSTAIRMSALTSLDVLNLDDQNLRLRLAQGGVNVRVRSLAGDNILEIDTPGGAVILGRPGSYRIDVDPSGATVTATVHQGEAEVLGIATSFRIGDHQQALIPGAGGADHDILVAGPADDFDDWAASRDRQEDRVAATRYVSDQMTGYEDLDEYGSWRVAGDYGAVWVPTVAAGWAPYRYGHWVWISPWGWTWVEDEPWGFAPFHYGRWVWLGSRWAWAPGNRIVQPVYAPALVAFVGGPNWTVSVGIGAAPAVGWVPLGWREPYIPWYRVSPTYVRHVNVASVRDVDATRIHNLSVSRDPVTHFRYANRNVPSAMTVVSRETFVSARPVSRATLSVTRRTLGAAPVVGGAPVATPEKTSLMPSRSGRRPPAGLATREAVAVHAPPGRAGESQHERADPGAIAVPLQQQQPRIPVMNPQNRTVLPAPASRESLLLPQRLEHNLGRERAPGNVRLQPQEQRLPAAPPVRERPTHERETQVVPSPSVAPPAIRAPQPPRARPDVRQERFRESTPSRPQLQPQPERARPPRERDGQRAAPRDYAPSAARGMRSSPLPQDPGPARISGKLSPPVQPQLRYRAPAPAVSQRPSPPAPQLARPANPPPATHPEKPRQSPPGERRGKRERE